LRNKFTAYGIKLHKDNNSKRKARDKSDPCNIRLKIPFYLGKCISGKKKSKKFISTDSCRVFSLDYKQDSSFIHFPATIRLIVVFLKKPDIIGLSSVESGNGESHRFGQVTVLPDRCRVMAKLISKMMNGPGSPCQILFSSSGGENPFTTERTCSASFMLLNTFMGQDKRFSLLERQELSL
jgi:hypothetical protein